MAKSKKKGLVEKVGGKKKNGNNKINPFEVKINRQKQKVVGGKLMVHDRGMPGVSRSKAIEKRKETLLVEYHKKGKKNRLEDRRFGENDPEMGLDEKMLQRFTKERQKSHDKANLYSLNDEEELTHYGQSLSEIEKFEDPTFSDEDDDEDKGRIGAKMVAEEHFGGFLSKRDEDGDDGKQKTWKERMEEIIAKSKKAKYERQHEREQNIELTSQLDEQWKELHALVAGNSAAKKKTEDDSQLKKAADDYDVMVRELMFEVKGKPSDRLKTEEELAKEEAERLSSLEEDRKRRMAGVFEEAPSQTHQSADSLDDCFSLKKKDHVRFEVAFKDGQLLKKAEDDSPDEVAGSEVEENKPEESESSEDEDAEEQSEDEDGEEQSEDEDADGMEGASDLESDQEDETEDEKKDQEEAELKETKLKPKKAILKKAEAFHEVLQERKKVMEEARKEIPYTFEAPSNYEGLKALLEPYEDQDKLIVLERLRKCHHPSLAEGNKAKLESLFGLLLELVGDYATEEPPRFSLINNVVQHLYELSQMSPLATGTMFHQLIQKKQSDLSSYMESHAGCGLYPSLDTLIHLKLITTLYPTSDFYHHVATPATLYMSQILTLCPINTRRDIACGLFLCNIFLEYVSFSKRYVPEVINFLCGCLFMASEKVDGKIESVLPPFKPIGRNVGFLELTTGDKAKNISFSAVRMSDVFSKKRALHLGTDEFRIGSLNQILTLLKKFFCIYKDLPCSSEIFKPVKYFAEKLNLRYYPEELKNKVKDIIDIIVSHGNGRKCLTMDRQLPPALKMFEPQFQEVFEDRKKHAGSREQSEKQRLIHKHKKEMKGAMRELRRDATFLANVKLQESLSKDADRKRKVKELFADLASQEGDFQALKRQKPKK